MIKPAAKTGESDIPRCFMPFKRSYNVAANMVGIARKNENSVAVFLSSPKTNPPMIVAPDLEIPGKSDKTWAKPTPNARRGDMLSNSDIFGFLFFLSIININTPPKINAATTVRILKRYAFIHECIKRPITAAGKNAVNRLPVNLLDSADPRFRMTEMSFSLYIQTTAKIAPSWMNISKTFALSPVKESRLPASMRWPVDETGKNSVTPSTIPSINAFHMLVNRIT